MSKEKFIELTARFKSWIDEGRPENLKFNTHLAEINRRLKRLATDFGHLMELNEKLVDLRMPKFLFDSETDTQTITLNGKVISQTVLKRADPNVPIEFKGMAFKGAFQPMLDKQPEPKEFDETMEELEGVLEGYYYNAHRILKLMQAIFDTRQTPNIGVVIVRNKLVEHTDQERPYSFGFSDQGPVVRPDHKPGDIWHDTGLVPNTTEFLTHFERQIEKTFKDTLSRGV